LDERSDFSLVELLEFFILKDLLSLIAASGHLHAGLQLGEISWGLGLQGIRDVIAECVRLPDVVQEELGHHNKVTCLLGGAN
jgi:hypothetical protein